MSTDVDILLGKLSVSESPSGRPVQGLDTTLGAASPVNPYRHPQGTSGFDKAADVDGLFKSSAAYVRYKKENPTHRLILWMRLNGQKPKEIALQLGITPQTVYNVQGQPWWQEAFCRLSTEMGKDAVTTFLEGEVLPALVRTVELAQSADEASVRLAANREILDRFLGKSVAKTETKISGGSTVTVFDVAKLQEESKALDEQLRARGISTGAN